MESGAQPVLNPYYELIIFNHQTCELVPKFRTREANLSEFELAKVAEFSRSTETEVLLDRVTAFRSDQDPAAIRLFETELKGRGVGQAEIEQRREKTQGTVLMRSDGSAAMCHVCERPATETIWGWQRLWGKVPLFPRPMAVCENHTSGRE